MANESTRANDENRTDTCQVLDAALEDGQLSATEHRERVSAATRATTLGDLEKLLADLQISRSAAVQQTPSLRSVRRKWGAAAAAVIVVAFGITWALLGGDPPASTPSTPTTSSGPTVSTSVPAAAPNSTSAPAPAPELLTLTGVTGVLAHMRSQFGDALGYQLNIYSDKAVVLRPDTANPRKTIEWILRDHSWTNMGPSTAVFSRSGIGDLSTFDVPAVLGVAKSAPQTLQLLDSPQTFLAIESLTEGGLHLTIHVSDNTRRSGSIVVGADGSTQGVERPAR